MSLTYLENRHNIHDSPWSDELIERLKVLWAEGLSATQIAAELTGKFTRMSVLGKVHRLKLPARKARQQPDRPYVRRRRRAGAVPKPPAPRPQPPRPRPPEPSPPTQPRMRSLTFFKLKPQHCRWAVDPPVDDLLKPARLFCAADVQEGEVYCAHHYRKARVPERRR